MNEEYLRSSVSERFSSQELVCFAFVVSWKIPIGKPERSRSAEPPYEFGENFFSRLWVANSPCKIFEL